MQNLGLILLKGSFVTDEKYRYKGAFYQIAIRDLLFF